MSYPLVRDLAAEGIPVRLTCGFSATPGRRTTPGCASPSASASSRTPTSPTRWSTPTTTIRSSATGCWPMSSSELATSSIAARLAAVLPAAPVVQHRAQGPARQRQDTRPGRARRPRPARLHPRRAGHRLGHRHHRAPDRRRHLYCCAIKDLFSNRIVGYALDERMTAQLAVTALRTAVARRQPTGVVVVHSDRGSQFRARSFRAVLAAAGLQGSMGRVASAGDNAAMESWHALLQRNVLRSPPLAHPRRAARGDRLLDRAHLQPAPPPARPGQAHPSRVRTRLHHPGLNRGMITTHPVSTEPAAIPTLQRALAAPRVVSLPSY